MNYDHGLALLWLILSGISASAQLYAFSIWFGGLYLAYLAYEIKEK